MAIKKTGFSFLDKGKALRQTAQTGRQTAQAVPNHPTPKKQTARAAISVPAGYAAQRSSWADALHPTENKSAAASWAGAAIESALAALPRRDSEAARRQEYYLEELNKQTARAAISVPAGYAAQRSGWADALHPTENKSAAAAWANPAAWLALAGTLPLQRDSEAARRQEYYLQALKDLAQPAQPAAQEPSFWDRVKDYFEQVGQTMDRAQDWARRNRVLGLSATEAPVEEPQQDAWQQYLDGEMEKAHRAMASGEKVVAHLKKSVKAMQEAQDWAQRNGVSGISATETLPPSAHPYGSEEDEEQKGKDPKETDAAAGAWPDAVQQAIDAEVQRAMADEETRYLVGHMLLPLLAITDGLNGLFGSGKKAIFGEGEGARTDEKQLLESQLAKLSPEQNDFSRALGDTAETLSAVLLNYLLSTNPATAALLLTSDFGSGVNKAREEGGGLAQQLLGGAGEVAQGILWSKVGGAAGSALSARAGALLPESLSLREAQEILETMTEWFGMIAEEKMDQLADHLKELF